MVNPDHVDYTPVVGDPAGDIENQSTTTPAHYGSIRKVTVVSLVIGAAVAFFVLRGKSSEPPQRIDAHPKVEQLFWWLPSPATTPPPSPCGTTTPYSNVPFVLPTFPPWRGVSSPVTEAPEEKPVTTITTTPEPVRPESPDSPKGSHSDKSVKDDAGGKADGKTEEKQDDKKDPSSSSSGKKDDTKGSNKKKEEKADKEGEEKASEKEAKDAVEKEDQERFGITGLHAHEKGLLTCHTTVTSEEATCTMDMPPRVKPDGDVEGVCRLVEEATNEIITKDAWFVIHNAYTAPKAEPKPAPKKTEAPAKGNSITFSLSIATAIVAAAIMC